MDKPKSKAEAMRELPMIDRIIFMANTLQKLEEVNKQKSHGPVSMTRKQANEKVKALGKSEAYRDVTIFIYRMFGNEMREKMKEGEVAE